MSYALVWKKTGLHAKFQVHRCFDMDLFSIIIICLCTSSEENRFTCKISESWVLWLVRFAFSKEEDEEEEEEEEDGQSVKIVFTCISHLL